MAIYFPHVIFYFILVPCLLVCISKSPTSPTSLTLPLPLSHTLCNHLPNLPSQGNLLEWVQSVMAADQQPQQQGPVPAARVSSLLDVRLQWAIQRGTAASVSEEDLRYVLGVALRCCHPSVAKRPRMKQVVHMLEGEDPTVVRGRVREGGHLHNWE